MENTARVPRKEITGIFGTIVKRMSKKRLGQVPDALGIMWNNPSVLMAMLSFSNKTEKKWTACDDQLKSFAHMAVASVVGCAFCLDFGYFKAHNEKLDVEKAREVPRWRDSDAFSPVEREVLAYAEAMSQTPPTVTDEMAARLLEMIGPAALVELTAFIGVANMATRTNVALGVRSQEFAQACGLKPLALPSGS